jgi:hypothetical protein
MLPTVIRTRIHAMSAAEPQRYTSTNISSNKAEIICK